MPVHELPPWADVTAMVIAAAFGAHEARRRQIPLFGVLLAGVVAGLGGGIVRDLMLGQEPVAVTTWYYVPFVVASAILLGVITGAFGGAANDLLAGQRATVMQEGPWLLSAVVCGSITFYLITVYVAFYPAVASTILVITAMRVLSVKFGWTSPVFPGEDLPPKAS